MELGILSEAFSFGHPFEKTAEALASTPKEKTSSERRPGHWRERNPRNVLRGN